MKKPYKIPCSICGIQELRSEQVAYICSHCNGDKHSPHYWKSIKKSIFNKRGKICDICKRTNGIDIGIHHIDKNTSNNSEDNLRILCDQCHASVHKNEGRQIKEIYIGSCGVRIIWE